MSKIYFYNTLMRDLECFESRKPDVVLLYTCGPTVYNYPHIGNWRTFLFEDILVRFLSDRGYQVKQVMNLTDVDDKTIRQSQKAKMSLQKYTEQYVQAFFAEAKLLNVKPAWHYPRATEHIPEMISMIQAIISNGCAYVRNGSVYCDIDSIKNYGQLAGLSSMTKREPLDSDEYDKENLADFVLWKAKSPLDGDVFWESPWGIGRPGWHIECSAMSWKHLGSEFDIHTGGVDNVFPHHVNELAQNQGAFGKLMARYWLHAEFLNLSGIKLSKSLGNVVYLKDLLDMGHDKETVRFALIQHHYRRKINFSSDLLVQAKNTLHSLNLFVSGCMEREQENMIVSREIVSDEMIDECLRKSRQKGVDALSRDLNMPEYLASIFELIRKVNPVIRELNGFQSRRLIKYMKQANDILGVLTFEERHVMDDETLELVRLRGLARDSRNYVEADRLRAEVEARGFILNDTAFGVSWRKQ